MANTETLRPNAVGDEHNIEAPVWSVENPHWELVDEVEHDGSATLVRSNEIDYERDLYNIADHSVGSGTINHIKVYARCDCMGEADQASVKIAIKTGGVAYESAEKTVIEDVWTLLFNQWDTNPNNAHAWTWEEIDALQIGVSLRTAHTSPAVVSSRCTQVYVEVDYTPYVLHEKTLTDSIAIGEVLVKNPIKVLSDGIALTDTPVKSTAKVLSDSIAFTDTLIKNPIKTLVDGIAFTDTLVSWMLYVREFTDGIAIGEILLKWRWLTPVRKLLPKRLLQPTREEEAHD